MDARTSVLFAATLLVAGCTVGPDYTRPEVALPEGWREVGTQEQDSLANTPWWELFNDPALVGLIEVALQENKDLAIAVERITEARARYGIQNAALYPQVDLGASAARLRTRQQGVQPLPPGANNETSLFGVGALMFWELDFFGRVQRASEAQLAQLYATEEARRAVVLSLVAEVARAYVELRDFDQLLEITQSTLISRREYVELARERFEGGLTSELDWRQAEAELHRTAGLVYDLERLVSQKENQLSSLLGRNPGAIPRGRTLSEMPVPPTVPAGLPSELLDRRPDIREAEEQLASATARIGEAKALLYPSIALTGSFGWESTELDNLLQSPAQSWSIGANLLQPIFDGGRNRSRVEVAESLQRQALYAYENTILLAFREVNDSLVGLRQSSLKLDSESLRVQAENQVLALAELRYRGGVSTYLEVLDAQRSLLDAQFEQSTANRDELINLIQLYKALGGGWPQAEEEPQVQTEEDSAP